MLALSKSDLARVQQLTTRCYPVFTPWLRTLFNEQLLESTQYWELGDWLERVELTYRWHQGERPKLGHRKAKPQVEAN